MKQTCSAVVGCCRAVGNGWLTVYSGRATDTAHQQHQGKVPGPGKHCSDQ